MALVAIRELTDQKRGVKEFAPPVHTIQTGPKVVQFTYSTSLLHAAPD
jgi:hypothetical protein